MANYLITGGAGFIGTNLVKLLLSQGHHVRSLDNYEAGRLPDRVQDGVEYIDVDHCKMVPHTSMEEQTRRFPKGSSWAKRVINTNNSAFFNSATLVCQTKGRGFRRHYHPDCDEFWVVLAGRMQFEIEGVGESIIAQTGDIVYAKKGLKHKMTVLSDEPAIRLSVSVELMDTVYD